MDGTVIGFERQPLPFHSAHEWGEYKELFAGNRYCTCKDSVKYMRHTSYGTCLYGNTPALNVEIVAFLPMYGCNNNGVVLKFA